MPVQPPKPTICKCGLAKSYHGGSHAMQPSAEYEPRYPADAVRLGWNAAMTVANDRMEQAVRLLKLVRLTPKAGAWDAYEETLRRIDIFLRDVEEGKR